MKKTLGKMKKGLFFVVILSLLLASCAEEVAPELPTPQAKVTSVPEASGEVQSFLDAWVMENYSAMYAMLSSASQRSYSAEDFAAYYDETTINATLKTVTPQVLSTSLTPQTASAEILVTYDTALFGSFDRSMHMDFTLEGNTWKINWEPGLILPELSGGNHLYLEVLNNERGAIYDSESQPIVEQTSAWSLAIIPNQIETGREGVLLNALSELTGKTTESIQELYDDLRLTDWYVAVGEASDAEIQENWDTLVSLGGLQMTQYDTRYYYNGGIAPQAIGYVLSIPSEQITEYQELGYQGDEKVGQAGLEKYAEESLAGKPAANLYVVDANNQIISRLNQADSTLPQNITTTINRELQIQAQKALEGFTGAIVAIEVDTGRVLAMASSPSLDTNLFDPNNRNSTEQLNDLLNDGEQRLLNRATQGTYPPGSTFKIIDMAAALESDLYTPDTTYYCDLYFEELEGERFEDWRVAKELDAAGTLTLTQGLITSCNPWFYHLGLDLFRQKRRDLSVGYGAWIRPGKRHRY